MNQAQTWKKALNNLIQPGGVWNFTMKRWTFQKGYERQSLVPEVHHCVSTNQWIHKADHVMATLGLLLLCNLVGDDVQPFVNLQ